MQRGREIEIVNRSGKGTVTGYFITIATLERDPIVVYENTNGQICTAPLLDPNTTVTFLEWSNRYETN